MSYFADYWQTSREPRDDQEKVWIRSRAKEYDDRWLALSGAAREAYLTQVRGAAKEKSQNQPTTSVNLVPAKVLEELVGAGLVEVQAASGKKGGRIMPLGKTYDFSARVRTVHRHHLLGPTNRDNLAKFVRYAYFGQGEALINRVMARAGVQDYPRIDEALENYVTTRRWPEWAAAMVESKAAMPLLKALLRAPGPVPLEKVAGLVPSEKPEEVVKALDGLIANLAVFEDVDPKTFGLVVGLLPIVRERWNAADKPRDRPPLEVVEKPREVGPQGGLAINDLRVFLLEVAGESPRLRQDGGIFQKDMPRFEAALPEWPEWLQATFKTDREKRLLDAHARARMLHLVEAETEETQSRLRLSGKGKKWLSSGLEDQYAKVYESYRVYGDVADPYYYMTNYNDSKFLGVDVVASTSTGKAGDYYDYRKLTPQVRQAQRDAIHGALERLPVGVYHVLRSVLDHLVFETDNPLTAGRDPAKSTIFLEQRPVPRFPERQEAAGKLVLEILMMARLIPLDAFRPAVDDQGRLCVARLPRSEGYFGREYDQSEGVVDAGTRVIVQPDFSVMVIGLDPAPAAELAPFCERSRGHLGEGAIIYKITRESVTRAASQGLSGPAIAKRLRKLASVEVPANVLKEVQEWAGWVRLVNVRQVTVVRCPDADTASRVVNALGRTKAERLGDTLVALSVPKINPADREKLQGHGIIVTKDDIRMTEELPSEDADEPATRTPKKRGRPKKVR